MNKQNCAVLRALIFLGAVLFLLPPLLADRQFGGETGLRQAFKPLSGELLGLFKALYKP